MPDRRDLIQKVEVLASSSLTVTFSNISQNYTDLLIVMSTRDQATTNQYKSFNIRPNNSTSNLTSRSLYGIANTSYSDSLSEIRSYHPSSTSASGHFGNQTIYMPNYAGSGDKTFMLTYGSEAFNNSAVVGQVFGRWASSSPITSLVFTQGGGDSSGFTAGSTFYLYGITHVPIINGGEVTIRNGYKIHIFKNTSTLQVVESGNVECLVVAGGGGGGGGANSGGGGAGGMRTSRATLTPGIYTVSVGAGGPGGTDGVSGTDGSNSVLSAITSTGGGGGGTVGNTVGRTGGSGGGGGLYGAAGGAGISGQGNNGGTSQSGLGGRYSAGGGGGAGGVGGSGGTASVPTDGIGGAGLPSTIIGYENYYAGGGGGGSNFSAGGPVGGIGGGGQGGNSSPSNASTPGRTNTGGGGGGGASSNVLGSAGGSGIVVIRYPYDGN